MKAGYLPVLACCIIACVAAFAVISPVIAADTITRGKMFTVSIAGRPNTAYYVWFKGTSTMSGQPGDQPPVIVPYVSRVEFDPDEGPYTIGDYKFYNGGGRTIREDVAPSSETVSNTRYYAEVTTDDDGYGIVQFQTSSATADRTFTIKAENPAAPGDEVPVRLGLPTTPATPAKTVTTITQVTIPPIISTIPAQLTTNVTAMTTISATITQETVPATTQPAPLSPVIIVVAVMAGLIFRWRDQ